MRLGPLRWNNMTTQKLSHCREDTRATWVLKAWQRVGHEGWSRVCLPPGAFPKNPESCWLTTRINLMSTLSFNYIIPNRSLWKKVSPKYIPTKNIGEGYWNKAEASRGLVFFFFLFFFSHCRINQQQGEILKTVLVGQIQSWRCVWVVSMFLCGWSIQRRIDSMMHQGCADVIDYLSLPKIYFPSQWWRGCWVGPNGGWCVGSVANNHRCEAFFHMGPLGTWLLGPILWWSSVKSNQVP